MKILFDDAIRFLMTKCPESPCPCCATDQWIVPYSEEDKSAVFLIPMNASLGTETAYNLELECSNCGFVRKHRAKFVEAWVSANKRTEAG